MKGTKKDLLYHKEKRYTENDYYLESDRRDVYYSALVKDIVKNNRTSQFLKCVFFAVVCLVFAAVSLIGMLVVWNVSKKSSIAISDVGIALTGFGGVLGSIIVLPQIIAKHLFPENSEQVRFDFIKENQKFDQMYYEDEVDDLQENSDT